MKVFKIPRDAEFPPPLQPHIESIKDITDRLQTIYTDAEVKYFFKFTQEQKWSVSKLQVVFSRVLTLPTAKAA